MMNIDEDVNTVGDRNDGAVQVSESFPKDMSTSDIGLQFSEAMEDQVSNLTRKTEHKLNIDVDKRFALVKEELETKLSHKQMETTGCTDQDGNSMTSEQRITDLSGPGQSYSHSPNHVREDLRDDEISEATFEENVNLQDISAGTPALSTDMTSEEFYVPNNDKLKDPSDQPSNSHSNSQDFCDNTDDLCDTSVSAQVTPSETFHANRSDTNVVIDLTESEDNSHSYTLLCVNETFNSSQKEHATNENHYLTGARPFTKFQKASCHREKAIWTKPSSFYPRPLSPPIKGKPREHIISDLIKLPSIEELTSAGLDESAEAETDNENLNTLNNTIFNKSNGISIVDECTSNVGKDMSYGFEYKSSLDDVNSNTSSACKGISNEACNIPNLDCNISNDGCNIINENCNISKMGMTTPNAISNNEQMEACGPDRDDISFDPREEMLDIVGELPSKFVRSRSSPAAFRRTPRVRKRRSDTLDCPVSPAYESTSSSSVTTSLDVEMATATATSHGAPIKPRRKKLSRRRGRISLSTESIDCLTAEIDELFSIHDDYDDVDWDQRKGELANKISTEERLLTYVRQWAEQSKKKTNYTLPLSERKSQHREKLLTQKTVKASGFVMLTNTKRKRVQQMNNLLNNISYTLALWGKSIRVIEGHHGAGVASYFLFLRWLFGLNIFLFVLMLSFIVLPMTLVSEVPLTPSTDTNYNASYYCSLNYTVVKGSGVNYLLEFIQGTGWMEKTLVFYGYYVVDLDTTYNLPLAYVLTVIACLVISLGLMARYTGKSFKAALLNAANSNFEYSNKVFGAWDFAVTDPDAADLKKKGIQYDLQSDMLEQTFMRKRIDRLENRCSMCKLYFVRLLINFFIISSLGAAAYLIFYVTSFSTEYASEHKDATGTDSWLLLLVQYLPSITITVCNALLPLVFEKVVEAEDYSQAFVIKITLVRTVFLRLASMIVLVITLYTDVSCSSQDSCRATLAPDCSEIKCWESHVGQQFYKLVITDLVVAVVKVFAVELPRKKLHDKCQCGLIQKIGPPEFNIPSNVLDLVYGQCLVWLGFLFTPLLPGMVVVKHFILFYVKKLSALVACPPSERPYKASRINTFFMIILLLAYFLCAMPVIFSIFGIKPSRSCGPFRVYDYMEESIKKTVESWPSVLSKSYDLITSTAVTGTIIILLSMTIYYLKTMSTAHKQQAELFKEQLIMEGRDKQFLLTKLQDIHAADKKKQGQPDAKKAGKDKKRTPPPNDTVTNVNEQNYPGNQHNQAPVSPPNVVDTDW